MVLGEAHFPVSCTQEAQAAFNRGDEAAAFLLVSGRWRGFPPGAGARPCLRHGFWGEAMTLLVNPFTVTTTANLRTGRALLAEAQRSGASSECEAGFIVALSEF
jgi:hypothetical protein